MKKIVIGNNVNIKMDDCIIEIDKISINATIKDSFSFNIIRGEQVLKTVEFPLGEQELLQGDYLDSIGIHREETEDFFEYTDEQKIRPWLP